MDARYFTKIIIEWYADYMRILPWRTTNDPYKIWLSEIILQQTRVSQGLPYYERFIREFPTVHDLASAPLKKVMRTWQGLGYYTRARNLHVCAKKISMDFSGKFPTSYEELKKLPGIGEYTAAAIASICYGEPVAVVDGNVFRVLARVYGIETPINTPEGKRYFTALANTLISKEKPATHNQAVMEFGALHCTPKNPKCSICVLQTGCVARKLELQQTLPVKIKSKKSKRRYFYYFVAQQNGSLLMKHRTEKDIWKGLYDFYMIEKSRYASPEKLMEEDAFLRSIKKKSATITISGTYKHLLSHQTIISKFVLLKLSKKPSLQQTSSRFYTLKKVKDLPKPVLISRFLYDFQLLKLP